MRASFFTHEPIGKSDDRRGKIALALDDCIREKGFAGTSLTDIALKAQMSPSHVRYYFETKEQILEFYLAAICAQLIHDITRIPKKKPLQWAKDFTAYFITNPELKRSTVALMIEIFAVAAHNPNLMKIKTDYDNFIRKALSDFFAWAGTAKGVQPTEAAYRLWVLEGGLKFNSMFQADFSKAKAGVIFEEEMLRLAGLKQR